MARAVWKGAITLGMFLVPIKLTKAVGSHDTLFHEYHTQDNGIVGRKPYCKVCGKEVDKNDTVKGIQIAKGEAPITFSKKELDELPVNSTKSVALDKFVSTDEIDPLLFESSYYVAADGDVGAKAFQLLLTGLRKKNRVGVGKITMRNRESICVVRPYGNTMLLSTICYADEVRKPETSPDAMMSDEEIDLIGQVIDKHTEPFEHESYVDEYTEAIRKLAEDKMKGVEPKVEKKQKSTSSQSLADALRALT